MPAVPKFRPFHTASGWCVSVPQSLSSTGRRVRKFFPSASAAEKFAAGLRRTYHAGQRGLISAELAMAASAAETILDGTGISLVEAARIARESIATTDSAERFAARYQRILTANEAHWSGRYLADMEKLPAWLGPAGMRTRCGELTTERIAALLVHRGPLAASTIALRTRMVRAILSPVRRRARQRGTIRIATLAEIAAMFRACATRDQSRALALLLFAGIRPEAESGEISRLSWSHVSASEIYIPPAVAKTGTDRHIPITPRLAWWIRGHPAAGPVRPTDWRRA
jgi:integrase